MADDGPDVALQVAVIAHLLAQSDITDLVADRVVDEPLQDEQTPYIRIGRIDVDPLRHDLATDWDVMLTIEAHSRPLSGRVEAARIGWRIAAALDGCEADVTLPGYALEWCQFEALAVSQASDAQTYVATVAFAVALSDA
jgi:hypothetical protein